MSEIRFEYSPAKKVLYVYHTGMFKIGMTERNMRAQGFDNLVGIYSRKANKDDDEYFLTGKRVKWLEYDNLKTLINDELKFDPNAVPELTKELLKSSQIPQHLKNTIEYEN